MSMLGESGGGHTPTAHLEPTSPGATSASEPEIPEVVIRPRSGWIAIDLRELFAASEFLFFLVWRDVQIRYKQTVLDAEWAVLQPLFTMIILAVINQSTPGTGPGCASILGVR
jgi:lipopolysaccharide transport system permease protein